MTLDSSGATSCRCKLCCVRETSCLGCGCARLGPKRGAEKYSLSPEVHSQREQFDERVELSSCFSLTQQHSAESRERNLRKDHTDKLYLFFCFLFDATCPFARTPIEVGTNLTSNKRAITEFMLDGKTPLLKSEQHQDVSAHSFPSCTLKLLQWFSEWKRQSPQRTRFKAALLHRMV